MKKIFLLLTLLPSIAFSCNLEIIGFKGLNSAFDHRSFYEYANLKNSCSKIFEWHDVTQAVDYINKRQTPYELYGFSKGANSVALVMRRVNRRPEYIITIGAWHTVNLDFNQYGVKFSNYFDNSGSRQQSPGVKITNIPHTKMQEYVNQFYK